MSRRLILASLLFALLIPVAAAAQESDEPDVIAISYFKCKLGSLSDVNALDASSTAIAQELIDSGTWTVYGILNHRWADEWNYMTYVGAPSLASLLSGLDTFNDRLEALPENEAETDRFQTLCTAHKDNIYNWVKALGGPAE